MQERCSWRERFIKACINPPWPSNGIKSSSLSTTKMSLVSSILALQAGNLQQQISNSVIKSNLDEQKSAVQTLLGGQTAASTANLGAGIGGNLNIAA